VLHLRKRLLQATRPLRHVVVSRFARTRHFTFDGRQYPYLVHPYNETWSNERAVEVPIVLDELRHAAGPVLEIGNVLSHYGPTSHHIVDKYERAPNVVNEDIETFTGGPYELIVTISTLEHVGWNRREETRPERLLAVLEHIRTLLLPGGRMVATVPLGYNHWLDERLRLDDLPWKRRFLRRISRRDWRQCNATEVATARYGSPYPRANAIAVLTMPAAESHRRGGGPELH
jgi:hypothetical protein